jgi:hypothetical protein
MNVNQFILSLREETHTSLCIKVFFFISSEFYKKCKGAPKHTGSIQKDTKTRKRGEGKKTPEKPK